MRTTERLESYLPGLSGRAGGSTEQAQTDFYHEFRDWAACWARRLGRGPRDDHLIHAAVDLAFARVFDRARRGGLIALKASYLVRLIHAALTEDLRPFRRARRHELQCAELSDPVQQDGAWTLRVRYLVDIDLLPATSHQGEADKLLDSLFNAANLTSEERLVLFLSVEGIRGEELQVRTGISYGTCRRRYHSALAKLKQFHAEQDCA